VLIPGAIKTKKSQCAESQRNKCVRCKPIIFNGWMYTMYIGDYTCSCELW